MTTKRRVARGTLPLVPAVEGEGETLDANVPPLRMTMTPPRVTTTTPGVIRKVLPR